MRQPDTDDAARHFEAVRFACVRSHDVIVRGAWELAMEVFEISKRFPNEGRISVDERLNDSEPVRDR